MEFFRNLYKRISRPWWINFHREEWYEWAKIERGGKVKIYDKHGEFVRGTDYGSKRKAIICLKRMGYHRFTRSDSKRVTPPGSSH